MMNRRSFLGLLGFGSASALLPAAWWPALEPRAPAGPSVAELRRDWLEGVREGRYIATRYLVFHVDTAGPGAWRSHRWEALCADPLRPFTLDDLDAAIAAV